MREAKDVIYYITQVAIEALLSEVSATPKPGLVDRNDNGAHHDMDFFTFISSTSALSLYFFEMTQTGYYWEQNLEDLFLKLREIGIEAEKAMFKATNDINTHKGLVFSIGILSAAAAYYYKKYKMFDIENIFELCSEMTTNVLEQEFKTIATREAKTHGERLYIQYGIKGIRGEVQNGFESVKEIALPMMKELMAQGKDKNEVYVQILLHLMANVEDTNILARHNMGTLHQVQEIARRALARGGIFGEGGKSYIEEMNKEFIKCHISPGGCADLLAITIMSYNLIEKVIN